jgi:hypothetical protein
MYPWHISSARSQSLHVHVDKTSHEAFVSFGMPELDDAFVSFGMPELDDEYLIRQHLLQVVEVDAAENDAMTGILWLFLYIQRN